MSNSIVANIIRFIILVLIQIAVFNQINFLGYINPYPYLLFVILFPISNNKASLLFFSFLIGLTIDMFSNSGGMHAAACLTIAFIRPYVLRSIFGITYEYNAVKISKTSFTERLTFLTILIITHHFVLYLLESFNVSDILYVLRKTLFSGIFTLVLSLILLTLFSARRK